VKESLSGFPFQHLFDCVDQFVGSSFFDDVFAKTGFFAAVPIGSSIESGEGTSVNIAG
jgi:hypothetical protein